MEDTANAEDLLIGVKAGESSVLDLETVLDRMERRWEKRFEDMMSQVSKKIEASSSGNRKRRAITVEEDSNSSDDEGVLKKKEEIKKCRVEVFDIEEEGELGLELDEEDELICSDGGAMKRDEAEKEEEVRDILLRELEEEFSREEKLGKKVKPELAKVVMGRFSSKLSNDMLKKRFDAYLKPENCPALVTPTVNSEIWRQMPVRAKKGDLSLANIQRCVVKAATAITESMEIVMSKDSGAGSCEKVKRGCMDAIALLGHASCQLASKRRQMIKPYINKSLHRLCEDGTVTGQEKLFGNDLPTSLKDLKEMEKLKVNIAPSTYSRPYHGQKQYASNSFLGGRGGWNRPRSGYPPRGRGAAGSQRGHLYGKNYRK